MSYSQRIERVANHLNYPKGLLAGQVAIITGSGQGIGAEAARLFANEGAKVVVADVDSSKYLLPGTRNQKAHKRQKKRMKSRARSTSPAEAPLP